MNGLTSELFKEAIPNLLSKFRTKFTLLDIKPPIRIWRGRIQENITTVSDSVVDASELSTSCKILRKDVGAKLFKV